MKVLLCHNFYQWPGGEDQVFADEGWLLESRGHQVVRYTLHNDAVETMGRPTLLAKTFWNRRTYHELRGLIRRERPALLHCHNTFPLISPSAYAAARAEGIAVVQTLHNYRLLCPSGVFHRAGRVCDDCAGRLVAWPAVAHACYRSQRAGSAVVAAMLSLHWIFGTWTRHVHRYIALSEFSRGKFLAGGLPARRVVVKPNFVPSDPGVAGGQGGYAVFVGRLSAEKGMATLLAAWDRLAERVPLKILGDGPLAGEVRAAASRDPRIEYLGQRAHAEVLAIVGDAACLVLPSLCYENCPKTVLEAYAKGTPVIAARLGVLTEMVHEGRTGLLFEAGNPEDLAAKVRRLWSERHETGLRCAARTEYQQQYTAEKNYPQLMEVYREALQCAADAAESEGQSQT